jgi:hypothetical protein
MRWTFLLALAVGTNLVFGNVRVTTHEEESQILREKTEKAVNDALEALRLHNSVIPEEEANYFAQNLELFRQKPRSSNNQFIRTSNKFLLLASAVMRKIYSLQLLENMKTSGSYLSDKEEKELKEKILDAVTGSKLREVGLKVMSLVPESAKQKNGAPELKKKIDDSIDAVERYWKMMDIHVKDIQSPFREKHPIGPISSDSEYDPKANEERRKRQENNNGLSLYGKTSRKNPNKHLHPERYSNGMKFPNQSADHLTDPHRLPNPHYPYLSDQEFEERKKETKPVKPTAKPYKDVNLFDEILDKVNDRVDKLSDTQKKKASKPLRGLNHLIFLLQNKLQETLPERFYEIIEPVQKILNHLALKIGNKNAQKLIKSGNKKIKQEIAKTALKNDPDFHFLFAKHKNPKKPHQKFKSQKKKNQHDSDSGSSPERKNNKTQSSLVSQPQSKEVAVPHKNEHIEPLTVPKGEVSSLDKLNGKVNDLLARVEAALDDKKKIDDQIDQKKRELQNLEREVEEQKKKIEQEKKQQQELEKTGKQAEDKDRPEGDRKDPSDKKDGDKKEPSSQSDNLSGPQTTDSSAQNSETSAQEKPISKEEQSTKNYFEEDSLNGLTGSQEEEVELPTEGDACECLKADKTSSTDNESFLDESLV